MALVLAVVTVVVAMTTAVGGITTSIAGALALNYFHTEPVHSLRISDSSDVVAVLLLGALGLVVSGMTALRLRDVARTRHTALAETARAELDNNGRARPAIEVWHEAVTACSADLSLVTCRIARVVDTSLPHVTPRPFSRGRRRRGVAVDGRGRRRRRPTTRPLDRVHPVEGAGTVTIDRRTLTAFVEHASMVLARSAATT